MNDLSDEDLVMTMIDLNFSPVLVLSRVCQISFGNLSHPDQHRLSHETQIFMSDDWSLRLTCGMNENHEVFSSRMCFYSPGLKIAQLRTDSGSFVSWSGQLYNSIALRSPGSLDGSQTSSSFPPPLSLMLRHITISPSREESHLHWLLFCSCCLRRNALDFVFCPSTDDPWCPQLIILGEQPPPPHRVRLTQFMGECWSGQRDFLSTGLFV